MSHKLLRLLVSGMAVLIVISGIQIQRSYYTVYVLANGYIHEVVTNAVHVFELEYLEFIEDDYVLDYDGDKEYDFIQAQRLYVFRNEKTISITLDGVTRELQTDASTINELALQMNESLYNYDNRLIATNYYPDDLVRDDIEIIFVRATKTIVLERSEEIVVQEVYDDTLSKGVVRVQTVGTPSIIERKYEVYSRDGQELTKTYLGETVIQEGTVQVVLIGTKTPIIAASVSELALNPIWDQLAACESGGRWNVDTGNGFSGGLQFMDSTWDSAKVRVGVTADSAWQATPEEQKLVASWLQINSVSGWGQWPACSKKLGLI